MSEFRPLTFQGSDVGLLRRLADGRVRVVYLDRAGCATNTVVAVQPHELRGIGWHLHMIKRAVAALALERPAAASPSAGPAAAPSPQTPARRGGYLFAHFAAPLED